MQNREDTVFSLVGFLLLSALGFFAWQSDPLESARPVGDESVTSILEDEKRVTARLWQDPLLYEKLAPSADQDDSESNSSLKNEIRSAISEAMKFDILAVMVDGGPYAELKEQRRRRRYAVLSALGDERFEPRDPGLLGIASCQSGTDIQFSYEWFNKDYENGQKRRVLILWLNEAHLSSTPLFDLYELVKSLVPSYPGRDIDKLPDWIVIGPSNSDTLQAMVKDPEKLQSAWDIEARNLLRKFLILSPLATASDVEMGFEPSSENPTVLGIPFSRDCASNRRDSTCFQFLRTLNADDALIKRLVSELSARKVGPTEAIAVISEWDTAYGRGLARTLSAELTARSESKSIDLHRFTYLRGIDGIAPGIDPIHMERVRRQDTPSSLTDMDESIRRPIGTAQFDYLRRLSKELMERDRQIRLRNGRGIRAVAVLGSDVYDKLLVLRALRKKLPGALWLTTDLDANYIHPAEYRWTRNLISSSSYGLTPPKAYESATPPFRDSYQSSAYAAVRLALNKQSLKSFLKTDTYTPGIYEVGRHGFIRLPEVGGTPYDPPDDTGDRLRMLLLGVFLLTTLGLVSFYQLLPYAKCRVAIAVVVAVPLFSVFFLGSYFLPVMEPISLVQGVSVWPTELIRIFAFFLALYWSRTIIIGLNQNWHNLNRCYLDPETTEAGKSDNAKSWCEKLQSLLKRANPLRRGKLPVGLAVALLSISVLFTANYFVISFLDELSSKSRVGILLVAWILVAGVVWSLRPHKTDRREAFSQRKTSAGGDWLLGSSVLLVAMFLVMVTMGRLSWPQFDRLMYLGIVWTIVISLWLMFIVGRFSKDVSVCSVNAWAEDSEARSFLEVWNSYKEYGDTCHRALRALTYTVVYFAVASVLFTLLPGGVTPCRGGSCVVDKIVLGVSVLTMLFLLFLVVDSARLCVYWIKKLQDPQLTLPNDVKERWSNRHGVDETHVAHWLKIQLIGKRTYVVDRLVYYPVIIILLMLVARSTFFDNWGFPQALAVVVSLNLIIAFASVMVLNYRAKQARDSILSQLEEEVFALQEKSAAKNRRAAEKAGTVVAPVTRPELEKLIKELKDFQLGAYQQIWSQPLVRSAILLVSGAGIAYTEHLSRF